MSKPLGPVSVVIPAFNEEAAVTDEIRTVREALTAAGVEHEIVVVDDGSSDATAQRAADAGATVLRHVENRGYGASLKGGISAAKYDIICITDADGTYPPDQIAELLRLLDTADMAVGARTGQHVKIPLIRKPAKWMLGWLANRIAGRKIPDLNSGLRAFRREVAYQYFTVLSNRFSFTTTITLAYFADDYRVVYHPINYYARIGRSKITPKHFMEFMILVLRLAMLFQPLRVFLPISLGLIGLGVLKMAADIVAFASQNTNALAGMMLHPVLSTSSALLLLMGVQMLFAGLMADGVIRRIAQQGRTLVPSRALVTEKVVGQSALRTGERIPAASR